MNERNRIRLARSIALAADITQWVWFPLMMGGAVSPFDDVLDVAVGAVLVWLIGWHWALLPAFVAELVPALDLAPTWTASVWLATRGRKPLAPAPFTGR